MNAPTGGRSRSVINILFVLFAGLKFSKVALTAGTMLLSFGVYAGIWGWRFAAGFLLLLLVHELGHVIAARLRGIEVSAPAFIPFMGAFISMRGRPDDAEAEAYIAYGGPFLGTLACFAVYFWARQVGSTLGLAVAYSGFFLNLFNLLPISPLDGGRITGVLGPRIWLAGAPLMLLAAYYYPSPMLLVIFVVALPHLLAAWRYDPNLPENVAYYGRIPARTKLEYAVLYLGLAALLAIMTFRVHDMLASVHGY